MLPGRAGRAAHARDVVHRPAGFERGLGAGRINVEVTVEGKVADDGGAQAREAGGEFGEARRSHHLTQTHWARARNRAFHFAGGVPASRPMACASDGLQNFRPSTVRGTAGCFRVGQQADGRWWLVDPDDRPCFLRAVNGVRAVEGSPYAPAARAAGMGFNALGAGADAALRDEGLPFVAAVDFAGRVPRSGSAGRGCRMCSIPTGRGWRRCWRARPALPWDERRELIGWLTDEAINWAQPSGAGRPSLLQICLSLEPQFAAWHAAWEFAARAARRPARRARRARGACRWRTRRSCAP